ncbi:RNA recognition motif [Carpediemonas membranifera]|uniref:RNA recognition motif n=1 Tax=Carpediemonas membranifera TaxID=201153 RepID=A0A8J6E1I0_9EUKA|nr:RNA recognition motif [Carpediemonas membranifera]|eukprot:KAG9393503.1 RNA recognition motif [Carpediemonas membranifera]
MSSWIFVGNVPVGTKREELQAVFPDATRVTGSMTRPYRHVGFDSEEARDAAAAKTDLMINDEVLRIEVAKSEPRRRPRRSPKKSDEKTTEEPKPRREPREPRERRVAEVGPESESIVFIGGLDRDCTVEELTAFIAANGAPTPVEVRVINPRRRFARRAIAFVEFAPADIAAAVAALNEKTMGENVITASKSTSTGVKTGERDE